MGWIRIVEDELGGVVTVGIDSRVTALDEGAERLTGWPAAEAVGVHVDEVLACVQVESGARTVSPVASALAQGAVIGGTSATLLAARDGTLRHVEQSAEPIWHGNEIAGARIVVRDVTAARQNAPSVERAGLGTLTASLVHEINNPLSYNLANLSFAVAELDAIAADGELATRLEAARAALCDARAGAERVRRLMADLRACQRPSTTERSPITLADVARAAIKLTWNHVRHRARLVEALEDRIIVDGDEAQLVQVVTNLLINGAQACDGPVEENSITVTVRRERKHAILEVTDTGCGLDAARMVRIFDPFFTTKAARDGSGLGLAICRSLVESHQGQLGVISMPGRGTTFRLTLPRSGVERSVVTAAPTPTAAPLGRLRILAIDDEPLILRALGRMLGGHELETITSPRAALRVVAERSFDVVLCDVMMPELSGAAFYDRACLRDPQLGEHFIFLSGGVFTQEAQMLLSRDGVRWLEKPFSANTLHAALRQLVETLGVCRATVAV